VGAILATIGAVAEELTRSSLLLFVLVGPLIEEILKPIGVIVLLESKPQLIRSRTQVIWLALVGALIFSFLENLIYVYVYFGDRATPALISVRYAVCTTLHLGASTILAMGLAREFDNSRKKARRFELENVTPYIIGAVALHGCYNFIVYMLAKLGAIPR